MVALFWMLPLLALGWAPADESSGPFVGLERQVRLKGKPTLTEAIEQVASTCDVRIILDKQSLQGRWGDAEPKDIPLTLIPPAGSGGLVLRRFLHPLELRAVKIGDYLLVTTEEMAMPRILRQPVQVPVRPQPLTTILRDLSRQTGAIIIIDPRAAEQAKVPISVALDDVSLETAIRVVAEMAGLKLARIDTVLYVTTPHAAASIRSENDMGTGIVPMPGVDIAPPAAPGMPGNAGPGVPLPARALPAQRNP